MAKSYFRRKRYALSLILLSVISPSSSAETTSMANLMRGMFTGLALLGQANNNAYPGLNSPGFGLSPWTTSPWLNPFGTSPWQASPWGMPPTMPGTPPWGSYPPTVQAPNAAIIPGLPPQQGLIRLLQGEWETHSGGLLLVKGSLARLYVSRDRYQDLQIRADATYLWMKPVNAGPLNPGDRYQYRIIDQHIVLRDQQQRILLLRRHQPTPD